MENKCAECQKNCCIDFKIIMEIFDPEGLIEILKKYPFVHKTDLDVIRYQGRERVVGGV